MNSKVTCRAFAELYAKAWAKDRMVSAHASRTFDLARALRLLDRVPLPVSWDAGDMAVTGGGVEFRNGADARIASFVDELIDLLEPRSEERDDA